jgi:hypothetical protein
MRIGGQRIRHLFTKSKSQLRFEVSERSQSSARHFGAGDLLSCSEGSRKGAMGNGLLEVGWIGHQQALVDQEPHIGRCRNLCRVFIEDG